MEKILASLLVKSPPLASKGSLPVVGYGITPDVVVGLIRIPRLPTFQKPGMFVGCMVQDKIEDYLEGELMGLLYQELGIAQGAEQGVDVAIISNVISEIHHRGNEYGIEPDSIDTKALDIIQPADDALQVSDSIMIAVLKASWIYLIHNAILPPS